MGFLIKNQRQPKQFSLKHRIYDERKDEIRRKMSDRSEVEIFVDSKSEYRERMRERIGSNTTNYKSKTSFNFRVITIFAILATTISVVVGAYLLMEKFSEL